MGIASHGFPADRLILDEQRADRAYLGDRIVWWDTSLGTVAVPTARLTLAAGVPGVHSGFPAGAAALSLAAPAPVVRASAVVHAVRAVIAIAAKAPVIPKVVAPPAASLTISAPAPTYRQDEVVGPIPTVALSVSAPAPVVGTAVPAVAAAITMTAPAPSFTRSATVSIPAVALSVAAPAPAYSVGVQAATATLSVSAPAPSFTQSASVSPPAASISVNAPAPVVGSAVQPPAAALSLAAPAPGLALSSSIAGVKATLSIAAPAPAATASSQVAAVAASLSIAAPAPAVTTGVTYTDDFNRANGALGSNWSNGNGTQPQISSNMATQTSGTDGYYPTRWVNPVTSDQWYVEIVLGSAPTSVALGALIRCNSGWTQQVGGVVTNSGTSIFTVTSATGGGGTSRASVGTVFSNGDTLRITASGNVYTVLRNGSSIGLSWTDTGGVIGTGSNNRYGGFAVQRGSFTNTAPVNSIVIADY